MIQTQTQNNLDGYPYLGMKVFNSTGQINTSIFLLCDGTTAVNPIAYPMVTTIIDADVATMTKLSYNPTIGVFASTVIGTDAHTRAMYSTDGINWAPSTYVKASAATIHATATAGAYTLLLGDDGSSHALVAYSADGIDYTNVVITPIAYSLRDATSNGTLAVAVGNHGTILTSTNLTTWTSRTSGITNDLYSVRWVSAKSLFVAVGAAGKILTSPDGITWTSRTSGVTDLLTGIVYNQDDDLIVVLDIDDGTTILTSANGTAWSAVTSDTNIISIAYSHADQVYAGVADDNSAIYSSTDLETWTLAYTADDAVNEVVRAEDKLLFTAVGATTDQDVTSVNGVTWTANTPTPIFVMPTEANTYLKMK